MTSAYPPARSVWALPKLTIVTFVTVIVMNLLHETGHVLTGSALGYDMVVNINSGGLASGAYRSDFDRNLIDFAGPLITILLAGAALAIGLKRYSALAPVIVFSALMMRILAAGASTMAPNDEARLGLSLGIGFWTLHTIVIALLTAMFVIIYRRYRLGWRWLLIAYFATSLAFAAIVFGEPLLTSLAL